MLFFNNPSKPIPLSFLSTSDFCHFSLAKISSSLHSYQRIFSINLLPDNSWQVMQRSPPVWRPSSILTESRSHPLIGNSDGLFSPTLGPARLGQYSIASVTPENLGGTLLLSSPISPLQLPLLLTLSRPALQAPHPQSSCG
jgi:hypothetical protein